MKTTIKRFVKKLNRIYDKFWDIRLGVDTQGIHPSSGTTKFDDSVECSPTSYRLLHKTMKKLSFKNPEAEIFVDYGCGKGRIICMFAQSGFKRIYGVEVSPVWAELAIHNVKKMRRRSTQDIRIITEDAVNFDCSEGTVFYFFNPFGEDTFREVYRGFTIRFRLTGGAYISSITIRCVNMFLIAQPG